jgi:hypothetical protein
LSTIVIGNIKIGLQNVFPIFHFSTGLVELVSQKWGISRAKDDADVVTDITGVS